MGHVGELWGHFGENLEMSRRWGELEETRGTFVANEDNSRRLGEMSGGKLWTFRED